MIPGGLTGKYLSMIVKGSGAKVFCLLSSFTLSFLKLVAGWKVVFCRVSKPSPQGRILPCLSKRVHIQLRPIFPIDFTLPNERSGSCLNFWEEPSRPKNLLATQVLVIVNPWDHKGQLMLTGRVQAGSATSLVLDRESQSAALVHLALDSRPTELWQWQAWV